MKRNLRFAAIILLLSTTINAQWSNNTALNTAVCTATNTQTGHVSISDGQKGAFVAWMDLRLGVMQYDIFVQHFDSTGTALWTANGVQICNASMDQMNPAICSDGSGGLYVTWDDRRSGNNEDIYAQRVNAAGVAQWTANGVAVCTAAQSQLMPKIYQHTSGALLVWTDARNGNYDLYSQRISSFGVPSWTANGVPICVAANDQIKFNLVSDGSNGLIIAWEDPRNGTTNTDIYAQRIDQSGIVQWTVDGVVVCSATGNQVSPKLCPQPGSGCEITWTDYRNVATAADVYAQRLSPIGTVLWTANGIAICNASSDQTVSSIVAVGTSNAVIAWQDRRSGTNNDIYVQQVAAAGTAVWTANGVAVCTATADQNGPSLITDAAGQYVLCWADFRNGATSDLYAQRIDASGNAGWTSNGIVIANATGSQDAPVMTTYPTGVIIVFNDRRSGNYDLYIQNVCNTGVIGPVSPATNITSSGAQTICSGSTTTLSASGTGTIHWYGQPTGGSILATGSNYTTPALTSNATYYFDQTTVCGVSQRVAVPVTVLPLPIVNLGSDITQCGGQATLDAGSGGDTYLWNTGATSQTIQVTSSGAYNVLYTDASGCQDRDTVNVIINAVPVVSLGSDITQCGPVTINAGNAGSTYLWSNNSTGQTLTTTVSGTYGVVVTNVNGCTGSDAINITSNALPVVNLGTDVAQCGGTVTLDAQNAGSGYLWSTGPTTQTLLVTFSGNYSVTVTDVNGCTGTDAINVDIYANPVVNLGNDIMQCGSITINAGNSGSTYLWSDNSTNQTLTTSTTGTYSVTVTDVNGCTGTDAINVTSFALPVVALGNDISQCGGNVTLDAQNPGSSYLWSNTSTSQLISVTTTGLYYVTVTTSDGCTDSDSINVTINTVDTSVTSGSGTFTANASGATYQWINCANGSAVNGATSQTFMPSANGTYAVVVTQNNCSDTSGCYSITNVGIAESNILQMFMYPNPASNELVIQVVRTGSVVLRNSIGQVVAQHDLNPGTNTINCADLAQGVYVVEYVSGDEISKSRLVIQR